MGIVPNYILISLGLITLFIAGLILIIRKLTMDSVLLLRSPQEQKGYQFWVAAMMPALGYVLVNVPAIFNRISEFGSKLAVTSLFPFLVCYLFIPVLIAFTVNIFRPSATSLSKAILFSVPVFLIHIYYVAQRWLAGLLMVLRIPDHPFRDYTFSAVRMELLVGLALLLEMVIISWLSATAIKQALKSRLT